MAENENIKQEPVGGADGADQPQVAMVSQYIKDLSFENPNAPQQFGAHAKANPAMDVNVNVGVSRLSEEGYEVLLKISAKAEVTPEGADQPQVSFIVELAFGAVFSVRNIPDEQLQPLLVVNAPSLMFPFARRIIADAVRDGGYPPLMLDPINFEALYRAELERRGQAQAAGAPAGGESAPIDLN